MASVETTTIRVRRSTHQRLQEEAERQGTSVTELLDEAADIFDERSMLLSAERAWEELAAMPTEQAQLDGALTAEEIARLEPDPSWGALEQTNTGRSAETRRALPCRS